MPSCCVDYATMLTIKTTVPTARFFWVAGEGNLIKMLCGINGFPIVFSMVLTEKPSTFDTDFATNTLQVSDFAV